MTKLATLNLKIKVRLLLNISAFIFASSFCLNSSASSDSHIQVSDLSVLQAYTKTAKEIQLSISGRDYLLKLWPSNVSRNIKNLDSKHYKGKVIGDNNSWVRLSYLDNQLNGYIKAFGELLEVDTLGSHANTTQIARKVNPIDLEIRTAGMDRVLHAPPLNLPNSPASSKLSEAKLNSRGVTRIMRLSIMIDSRFDDRYNGQGLEKAISTINGVDGLYQEQFGLAIQLDSALLLSETNDPFISHDGNIEQLLRAFRHYSLQNKDFSSEQTALHLFSGSSDKDNIIGLSWINTACRRDGYNASVSTAFSEQMLLAAHELAHNLGAIHDNAQSCDIEYNQVMWPNISSATASRFSACSKAAVIPKLNASCNLDNIDVGISLELKPRFALGKQFEALAITAHNMHSYHDAPNIHSATFIQTGITVSNLPDRCFQLADTVYCDHGKVTALNSNSIEFYISYSKTDTQIVSSEIDAPEINDIARANNNAVLDLNNPGKTPDYDDSNPGKPYTDASSERGTGALGFLTSLCMFFLVGLRVYVCRRNITQLLLSDRV